MKTKILAVHQAAELYGSDRVFLNSVISFRENYKDAEIHVLLPCNGPLVKLLSPYADKVMIQHLGILRKKDLSFFYLIRLLIIYPFRAYKNLKSYDITYINTIVILDYIIASIFSKGKSVIHIHEIPTGMVLKIFGTLIRLSNAYLIFNSQETKKFFSEYVQNKNLSKIENGIKGYLSCDELEMDVNSRFKILLIGRINSWKGHSLLLEAISLLPEHIKQKTEVKFVGDVYADQYFFKEDLVKKIETLHLKDIVGFHSFSDDPTEYYNWANIVVIPSVKPEPFGLVAIEGMSAGRLVIAANHGGLKQIIQDCVTGLLFEPNNAGDLAEKLLFAFENPSIISGISANGKSRFIENYTEDSYKNSFYDAVSKFYFS